MKTHELKTDPDAWDAVAARVKTHEIRKNDRGYEVGDTLLLRKTLHSGAAMRMRRLPLVYLGEPLERVVTHIQEGYGLSDHWVILSLDVPMHDLLHETVAALEDLSFASHGGIGTYAPDTATYNRTFAVLDKARKALGVTVAPVAWRKPGAQA